MNSNAVKVLIQFDCWENSHKLELYLAYKPEIALHWMHKIMHYQLQYPKKKNLNYHQTLLLKKKLFGAKTIYQDST